MRTAPTGPWNGMSEIMRALGPPLMLRIVGSFSWSTDRTVGEPRGEDGLLAGPSFAAHERAGDLAGGVQLLFVIAREREEVDPLPRLLRHHGRAQHDGVALPDDHSAVGLLGHPPGLHRKSPSGDVYVFRDCCHAKYIQECGRNPAVRLWVRFLAAAS